MSFIREIEKEILALQNTSRVCTKSKLLKKLNDFKERLIQSPLLIQQDLKCHEFDTNTSMFTGVLAYCLFATEIVLYTLQQCSNIQERKKLQILDCVDILEDALIMSISIVRGFKIIDNKQKSKASQGYICSIYGTILQYTMAIPQIDIEKRQSILYVISRIGGVLAHCWVQSDSSIRIQQAMTLLQINENMSEVLQSIEPWRKFHLGAIQLAKLNSIDQALSSFKQAFAILNHTCTPLSNLVFWYAITLAHKENIAEAIVVIEEYINNYGDDIRSLNLLALFYMHNGDFYESLKSIQKALGIDFSCHYSLYNYSILLLRMKNTSGYYSMIKQFVEVQSNNKIWSHEYELHLSDKVTKESLSNQMSAFSNISTTSENNNKDFTSVVDWCSLTFANNSLLLSTTLSAHQVYLELANAALENYDWEQAQLNFGKADVMNSLSNDDDLDYIYTLLQCDNLEYAIIRCNNFIQRLELNPLHDSDYLIVYFYRADALFGLGRVQESYEYFENVVCQKMPLNSEALLSNKQYHIQLINNIAISLICSTREPAALQKCIKMLKECLHAHPDSLQTKFNLVLLLWRENEYDVATSIWIEARGWKYTLSSAEESDKLVREIHDQAASISNVPMQTKSHTFVETKTAITIACEIENGISQEMKISQQQLVYLDILVLNYWETLDESRVVHAGRNFINYLDQLYES